MSPHGRHYHYNHHYRRRPHHIQYLHPQHLALPVLSIMLPLHFDWHSSSILRNTMIAIFIIFVTKIIIDMVI